MSTRAKIILAFLIVYVVWGSTYLAIRIAVEHLPPALFAGLRFDIAGPLMLALAWAAGARLPTTRRDWRNIAVSGLLMLGAANGLVTWSEQWIASGEAALIVATSALWMAGLGALGPQGEPFGRMTLAGLLLGFGGVALLVAEGLDMREAPLMAYGALILAPLLWAAGSIHARRHPPSCPPLMTAALQMCFAGVAMTVLGLAAGELPRWNWHPQAVGALAYLIVFGSCIAYGAYIWLVREVRPATLGTYAYVNPAIAVLLGWLLLDEHLGARQVAGTAVIIAGVLLVSLASRSGGKH